MLHVTKGWPYMHASMCKRSVVGPQINSGYSAEQLQFSSLHPYSAQFIRSVEGQQWWVFHPPLWASCPILITQRYKSTQDTLLRNFHFLHYTKILHCLKDQWWAFGPPQWASGQILNVSAGQDDLEGLGKYFFLFYDFFFQSYIFWPPGVKNLYFNQTSCEKVEDKQHHLFVNK